MTRWRITIPETTFVVESIDDAPEVPEPEPEPEVPALSWDFDASSNPCWAYTSERNWLDQLPIGATPVVPLHGGGKDFATNLKATVDSAGKRVIVQLKDTHYIVKLMG